jgi:hypothetical protein
MTRSPNGNPVIAGVEFEKKVNLTSILTFIFFIFSVGGIYADLKNDMTALDGRTSALQIKYDAQATVVTQQDKDIALILERISETQVDVRDLKRLIEKIEDRKRP